MPFFPSEWPAFVASYAPWWASHALSWLKFGRRLLVVHYEELQSALLPQLHLIMAFLNITVSEEQLLCAQSNQDGHFKRSGVQQPSFDPFTPDMRRMIDSFIHTVHYALQSRNFSGLPQVYLPRWWTEEVIQVVLNNWFSRGFREEVMHQVLSRKHMAHLTLSQARHPANICKSWYYRPLKNLFVKAKPIKMVL